MTAAVLFAIAVPAHADQDDMCVDRPGIGTPPCTLGLGQAMVEVTAGGWEHTRDRSGSLDEVTLGDVLLRTGVGGGTELRLGLASHVIHRERDRLTGERQRESGTGDAVVGLRHNFGGGDGPGQGPVAIELFATLPIGRPPLGDGRVGAGVLVPVEIGLARGFELDLTPEADLDPDEEGHGRHLTWGGVAGLSHALTGSLTAVAEVAAFRAEETGNRSTDARVTGSFAWQAGRRLQLDVEFDAGISAGAPDRAVLVGLARQFR